EIFCGDAARMPVEDLRYRLDAATILGQGTHDAEELFRAKALRRSVANKVINIGAIAMLGSVLGWLLRLSFCVIALGNIVKHRVDIAELVATRDLRAADRNVPICSAVNLDGRAIRSFRDFPLAAKLTTGANAQDS